MLYELPEIPKKPQGSNPIRTSSSHPAFGRAGAHARFGQWRQRIFLGAGALMAALFVYSLVSIIPSRAAVRLERKGVSALLAGRYVAAERAFNGVVRLEPRSTHARFGLACAFALTGSRGLAVLELDLALKYGLILNRSGGCGHGLVLSENYFAAGFGLSGSFAAPRSTSAYQRVIQSVPADTPEDTGMRLLIGSCLAFRARLNDVGWYYAANAHDEGQITRRAANSFFACLGAATRSRLHCRHSLAGCIFTAALRASYFRDDSKLYPTEEPSTGD